MNNNRLNKKIDVMKFFSVRSRLIFVNMVLIRVFVISTVAGQAIDDAQKYVREGDRANARRVCKTILAKAFDSDACILLGRTYAWDNQFDSARVELQKVLSFSPGNNDALSAIVDVEYWAGRYDEAIGYCNIALAKDSLAEPFLVKKARVLRSKGSFARSSQLLEHVLRLYPSNGEAMQLLKEVRIHLIQNKIAVNSTFDFFDGTASDREPWQLYYVQYTRKMNPGAVIGRLNYAHRYGKYGYQAELDAYPHLSSSDYLYLNFGCSGSSIFPGQKGGVEWFHSFWKKYEFSFGSRVLHFRETKRSLIYTTSLSKYAGNFWISARAYFSPDKLGTSFSAYGFLRRYFADPENYLGVRIGGGSAPDERMRLYQLDLSHLLASGFNNRLNSQSFKAEYSRMFDHRWIVNVGATVAREKSWMQTTASTRYGINWNFESMISYQF